ncbi:MAG TPA: 23S rRNA (adenine(2503)-C(2))-methyltransferase RlmN [Candidatus Pelethosoma merdigallinarum]|nr:23S rRNA (adenine(2503)-C(2))-methyltransferase RlmN [Candidatus Pelethosoma merdigallinarum]
MKNIYGETHQQLEQYFLDLGEKKFKATQVFEWLYEKRVSSFEEMSNVKKSVIQVLQQDYVMEPLKIMDILTDVDVHKYLFQLSDGEKVEAVLMKHDYGNSICVSTQVGCNMGCTFCESGRLKKRRNLEAYEMVLQLLMVEEHLGERISRVVLMGIGEPFDNYENVMKFIDIINHPKGMAIGARHITISTCGIIPKIKEFMKEKRQVNLAISLHAPNDTLRSRLMPINKSYPLTELIPVLKEYVDETHRRLTFEYIMLKGINDQKVHAIELAKLLRGINCYVNLIPYNETSHIEYEKSSKERILQFYDTLKKEKINVTIRREFGSKVMAACGQLRSHYEEGK